MLHSMFTGMADAHQQQALDAAAQDASNLLRLGLDTAQTVAVISQYHKMANPHAMVVVGAAAAHNAVVAAAANKPTP